MTAAATGTEVVVVGGGIAGVSAAAFAAAAGASVTLVEREADLSAHTTGRSAALLLASYGPAQARRLTAASRGFLDDPPDGFVDGPLLAPRGVVWVGTQDDRAMLAQVAADATALDPGARQIDASAVRELCPVLRPEHAAAGVLEPSAADIGVAALHAGFVRMLRRAGAVVLRAAPVLALSRTSTGWTVTAGADTLGCDVVVDAAGAWGDQVAALASLAPLGLQPLRRTAMTVALPPGTEARGWPSVNQVRGEWYFKPEGDGLLVSPADQTPSAACDARPDPLDVVLGLERVAAATTLTLRSVRTAWAGLRTFCTDGELAIGPDPADPSFVWCVGQGGYGIQTAAAAGRLTADSALGLGTGWAAQAGIDTHALAPGRLSTQEQR